MKSHSILQCALGITALGFISACSTVNEKAGLDVPEPKLSKTGAGAVTGAAIGGGLGLIIGSTSGSAGEGLLVGSVAGGALGAGIGAKLQKDDEKAALNTQQDSVIRQSEQINQQNVEINDLKKNSNDEVRSFYDAPIRQPVLEPEKELKTKPGLQRGARGQLASRGRAAGGIEYLNAPSGGKKGLPYGSAGASEAAHLMTASVRQAAPGSSTSPSHRLAVSASASTTAKKVTAPITPAGVPASVRKDAVKEETPKAETPKTDPLAAGLPAAATGAAGEETTVAKIPKDPAEAPKDLANCKEALKEAERGLHAGSDADRLFYLRRAARLCPTEPSYHVELGKLYSTIGKAEDAKYELRQAIDLDPNNQVARDELSILENSKSAH